MGYPYFWKHPYGTRRWTRRSWICLLEIVFLFHHFQVFLLISGESKLLPTFQTTKKKGSLPKTHSKFTPENKWAFLPQTESIFQETWHAASLTGKEYIYICIYIYSQHSSSLVICMKKLMQIHLKKFEDFEAGNKSIQGFFWSNAFSRRWDLDSLKNVVIYAGKCEDLTEPRMR